MRNVRTAVFALSTIAFVGRCAAGTVSDVQVAAEDPTQPTPTEDLVQRVLPLATATIVTAADFEPTATTAPVATVVPIVTATAVPDLGTVDAPLSLVGSGFTWFESGTEWTVSLTGMIETSTGGFNDETGTCLVLFGTLVPDQIEDGLVSSGFDAPSFGIIADGQFLDSKVNECNTDQIEAVGYQWILNAEVSAGTVYPFFTEFFIPGDATPEAVVAGRPTSNDATYFSPDTTETITAP